MGLQEQEKKETHKKVIDWILLSAAGLLMVGGIVYLGHNYWVSYQNQKIYESMQNIEPVYVPEPEILQETETATEEKIYCSAEHDFAKLWEQNEDIYAWITVPGTQTDYPVLQSETDNYYLDYNIDHSKGYPGCIYSNQCNAKDFSDNLTVLYGHNMKNGTMFGNLHSFEDETFFKENRTIYVYTPERRLTYEIYAAVKFSNAYITAFYPVDTDSGRDAFLTDIESYMEESVSHKQEDMEIGEGDKILVLSTCVNGEAERRYLIVGKLVEEAFYE